MLACLYNMFPDFFILLSISMIFFKPSLFCLRAASLLLNEFSCPVVPETVTDAERQDKPHVNTSPIRKDVSQLIQDAGFRTKIDSDIQPLDNLYETEHVGLGIVTNNDDNTNNNEDPAALNVESPKFVGFTSSPPPVISDFFLPGNHDDPDTPVSQSPRPPASDAREDFLPAPSSHSPSPMNDPAQREGRNDKQLMSSQFSLQYTNQESESQPSGKAAQPQTSQAQPLNSTVEESQYVNHRPASGASSVITNPFYNSQDAGTKEAERPNTPPAERPVPSTAPAATNTANTTISPPVKRNREIVSSPQQRPSPSVAPEEHSNGKDSPPNATDSNFQAEDSMLASQIPEGSQVVDLTLSSDPMSPANSDGDFATSQGLPEGSGWVTKRKKNQRSTTSHSSRGASVRSSFGPKRRGVRNKRSVV